MNEKCQGCGNPLVADRKDFHVDPHSCDQCRQNYCIEHAMDRRHDKHPKHCVPGEW